MSDDGRFGDEEQTAVVVEPAESAAPHSAMQSLFYGEDGLRPGWGLLIFLAILIAVGAISGVVVRHLHPDAAKMAATARSQPAPFRTMALNEGIPFLLLVLVTWVMSRIERRPVGVYGFGGGGKLRYFCVGLAWGFAFLSLLVLALWKLGLLVFTGQQVFGFAALGGAAKWALAFLLVGLLEEYLLRGYLQYTLARGLASLYGMLFETKHQKTLGFWTAALVLSFIFGLGHGSNPGESPVGLFSAGAIGMIFCLTLWRTGSLWWALGFHAAWDWAQSFVYGVADSGMMVQGHLLATHPSGKVLLSGGATGPEGSLLILPLMAMIVVVVLLTLPARALNLDTKRPEAVQLSR